MFRRHSVVASTERPELPLSAFQRRRLAGTWVLPFRDAILPLIDEQSFAPFYHERIGAPNRSVAVVLGILLLKDIFALTDQQALDQFTFDLRWHIALDIVEAPVSCCQKTLHNFRVLLREHEKARLTFENLTDKLIGLVGLDTSRQRLDSTHCRSNVAILKRLGLFCQTIELFLRRLRCCQASDYDSVPESVRRRYHTAKGQRARYHGAASALGRRRLAVVARDLFRLLQLFGTRPDLADWPELTNLKRVLAEQCERTEQPQQPEADDDDHALGSVPVRLRQPKEVSASSLQTPHDPDVTYGKKGQGYEVQICETFGNKNKGEAEAEKPSTVIEADTSACPALVATNKLEIGKEQPSNPATADVSSSPKGKAEAEAAADKPSTGTESDDSGCPPLVAQDKVEIEKEPPSRATEKDASACPTKDESGAAEDKLRACPDTDISACPPQVDQNRGEIGEEQPSPLTTADVSSCPKDKHETEAREDKLRAGTEVETEKLSTGTETDVSVGPPLVSQNKVEVGKDPPNRATATDAATCFKDEGETAADKLRADTEAANAACPPLVTRNKDETGADNLSADTQANASARPPLVAQSESKAGKEQPSTAIAVDASSCPTGKPGAEKSCPNKPELITHVEVTPSCQNDIRRTMPILKALAERKLLPEDLEADSNYTNSEVIQEARELGTEVNGPVMGSKELPKKGEVTLGDFRVDLPEASNSRCPAGQPLSRQEVSEKGRVSLAVLVTTCQTCELASRCPMKAGKGKHKDERVAQTSIEELTCEQRRRYETTAEFREKYAWRAGIEATNSEMKRAHGLGQLPVRGQERVKVAVYLKALACNVKRVATYLGRLAQWQVGKCLAEGRAALAAGAALASPTG